MEDTTRIIKDRSAKNQCAACASVMDKTANLIGDNQFKGIIIISDDTGIFLSILNLSPEELLKESELIIARLTSNLIRDLSDETDNHIPPDCVKCDSFKVCYDQE